MYPIPDLSYFAIEEFVSELRKSKAISSSIILNNGKFSTWNVALSSDDPKFYTWLHENTGVFHNVYLPFTPNRSFMHDYSYHVSEILQPAKLRILACLRSLDVKNAEQFMRDSDDWLGWLFAKRSDHFAASEMAAEAFGIEVRTLPMIVVWNDLYSKQIIKIIPAHNVPDVGNYLRKIYTAITNQPKTGKKSTADILYKSISIQINEIFSNDKDIIPDVSLNKLKTSVIDVVKKMGIEYSRRFKECILSYEEQISQKQPQETMNSFCSRKHKELERDLGTAGFTLIREGRNHERWEHPESKIFTELPRHINISPGVAKHIHNAIKQSKKYTI